ncbi:PRC-barrel domain-containing protein [Sphingomonas sp. PAMC 26621]|uniref:PRC-barrel domain-containing protein n=1 Tax=Sphingomonas sp. PAMC 26621 TaxID=1112213 RepID=UPI00028899A2|nr:PRC-barrel domain-containing protein [Sphingomonas sp. PAMC 26621]
MLNALSSLRGLNLQATDGVLGTISDFLLDDATWKVRWMVVDTGGWLIGRTILIHPSAVTSADAEAGAISVALTKAQVEESPDVATDRPISQQLQNAIYGYYGWDPLWGEGMFGGGMYGAMAAITSPVSAPALFGAAAALEAEHDAGGEQSHRVAGDPHLRSFKEVKGYHVEATDGEIGHVADLLVDMTGWHVRYIVVDRSNWWFGQQVLISPAIVKDVDWPRRRVGIDIDRERVKSSPPWSAKQMVDGDYERLLHAYYA